MAFCQLLPIYTQSLPVCRFVVYRLSAVVVWIFMKMIPIIREKESIRIVTKRNEAKRPVAGIFFLCIIEVNWIVFNIGLLEHRRGQWGFIWKVWHHFTHTHSLAATHGNVWQNRLRADQLEIIALHLWSPFTVICCILSFTSIELCKRPQIKWFSKWRCFRFVMALRPHVAITNSG